MKKFLSNLKEVAHLFLIKLKLQKRKWHSYIKLETKTLKAFMVLQVKTKNAIFGSKMDEKMKQHRLPFLKHSSRKVVF